MKYSDFRRYIKKVNDDQIEEYAMIEPNKEDFIYGLRKKKFVRFSSELFAVSAVLALVVMYDAAGVRRAAGEQAKILNLMVEEWESQNFKNTEVRLKELLGHTPLQVFAGAILGIVIAVLRHLG